MLFPSMKYATAEIHNAIGVVVVVIVAVVVVAITGIPMGIP